jgi:hypothetical protein
MLDAITRITTAVGALDDDAGDPKRAGAAASRVAEVRFRAQQLPRARSTPQAARRLGMRARVGDRHEAEVGRQASQNTQCHRSPEVPSTAGSVTPFGTSVAVSTAL